MNASINHVILVDEQDNQTGLMDKLEAHEQGALHRAFSIMIFNPQGDILLHQRAMDKYHSCGLWTNACCSHPRIDETMEQALHRRLIEEMNFDCPLFKAEVLHYQTPPLDTGLIENEMLHLYVGRTEQAEFQPNPEEVMAWRWISPAALLSEVKTQPEKFSFWFQLYLQKFDLQQLFALTA